jgi:hypothetical protein
VSFYLSCLKRKILFCFKSQYGASIYRQLELKKKIRQDFCVLTLQKSGGMKE